MAAELPTDLREQLAHAADVLAQQEDGELPLAERRAIRERFGAFEPLDAAQALPGLRRRVALAQLAPERVLPLWHEDAGAHDGPETMLELARRRLERAVGEEEAERLSDRFNVEAERLASGERISQRALAAGEAARVMVGWVDIGDYEEPPETDDGDLDPDNWEPEYVASVAAGGYPVPDPEALRAYWRWYLDDAVPAAWRAG